MTLRRKKGLFVEEMPTIGFRYPEYKKDALRDIYGHTLPRLLRGLADELLAEGLLKKKLKSNEEEKV